MCLVLVSVGGFADALTCYTTLKNFNIEKTTAGSPPGFFTIIWNTWRFILMTLARPISRHV